MNFEDGGGGMQSGLVNRQGEAKGGMTKEGKNVQGKNGAKNGKTEGKSGVGCGTVNEKTLLSFFK